MCVFVCVYMSDVSVCVCVCVFVGVYMSVNSIQIAYRGCMAVWSLLESFPTSTVNP